MDNAIRVIEEFKRVGQLWQGFLNQTEAFIDDMAILENRDGLQPGTFMLANRYLTQLISKGQGALYDATDHLADLVAAKEEIAKSLAVNDQVSCNVHHCTAEVVNLQASSLVEHSLLDIIIHRVMHYLVHFLFCTAFILLVT